MLRLLQTLLRTLVSLFQTQRALALENLALRQQVALLKFSAKRPRSTAADRFFWVVPRQNKSGNRNKRLSSTRG